MDTEQLLFSSKTISLSLPDNPTQEHLQTAFIILCGLRQLGKYVLLEGKQSEKPLLSQIGNNARNEEKAYSLILKGIAPFISRVYYEKDANDLKFFFSLSRGSIEKDQIQLSFLRTADLAVIIGNPSSRNDQAPSIDANEVRQSILRNLLPQQAPSLHLTGIAYSKLEQLPGTPLFTGVLASEDFQTANASTKDIAKTITNLSSFGPQYSFAILYQPNTRQPSSGIVWSPSEELREKVVHAFGGSEKNQWVLFSLQEQNLPEAKIRLINTLSPLWHQA